MSEKTYNAIKSNIMTYVNDQNKPQPTRSYKANGDCIKAILSVAHDLLTREEFGRLWAECIEW